MLQGARVDVLFQGLRRVNVVTVVNLLAKTGFGLAYNCM